MTLQQIGPYTITTELKRGPHGRLFLAVDSEHGREVAIKLLDGVEYADPTIRARFKLEAQLLANLESPAILASEDLGELDGQLYTVARWMPGGSLAESLRYGPLPVQEAARILEALAAGLDAVHALGILHGDIQPSNILFDENDNPLLADFGLTSLLRAQVSPESDVLVGPPAYLSPESALAGARIPEIDQEYGISPASDQYMLAAVLFEALTGSPPYQAATPLGLAVQHHTAPIPQVSRLRPGLSPLWDEILTKALAKDPAERYASVSELSAAVSSVAAVAATTPAVGTYPQYAPPRQTTPGPATIPPPRQTAPAKTSADYALTLVEPAPPPPPPQESRKSRRSGFVLTLLLILIAIAAVAVFAFTQGTWLPSILPVIASASPTQAAVLPESSPIIQEVLAIATDTRQPSATLPPPPTATVALPSSTTAPTLLPSPTVVPVTPVPPTTYDVQYNDTLFTIASSFHVSMAELLGMNNLGCNSRLAVGKPVIIPPAYPYTDPAVQPQLTLSNYTSLSLQHILDCTTKVSALDFSPDGKLLAVASDDFVYLWNVGDWKPYLRLAKHYSDVSSVAFSPDGQTLASASYDGTVILWQVSDGQVLRILKGHGNQVTDVAFHPGGQQLTSTSRDNTARIWQVDGTLLHTFSGYPTFSAAYAADGDTLALGYADSVRIYRLSDLSLVQSLISADVVSHLVFSPDGMLLASSSDLWHVSEGRKLYHFQSSGDTPVFTSDGLALVTGRNVWKVSNGSLLRVMESPVEESARTGNVWDSVAYSPATGIFAWGTPDGLFIYGLPSNVANSPNPSHRLHVVVPGDNIYNLASGYQVNLTSFLALNGITCSSPIFSGQNLWIPDGAGLNADLSRLEVIRASNASQLTQLRSFENTCALTNSDFYFSADSQKLISGSSLWDVPTGSINIQVTNVPRQFDGSPDPNLASPLMIISPDQLTLAVRSCSQVQLWEIATGRLQRTLEGHKDIVTSLVFSPDGKTLVSGSSTGDQKIIFWNPVDGSQLKVLDGWTVVKLTFTQDGQFLIGEGDDTVRIWRMSDWRLVYTLSGLAGDIAYSPDASLLAFASCSETSNNTCIKELVSLYKVSTGTVSWSVSGFGPDISTLQFSPDGKTVAAASGNGITLVDVGHGLLQRTLYEAGNLIDVTDLLFSPDGSLLVSTWANRAIRIWDTQSGAVVYAMRNQPVERMAFSPDGRLWTVLYRDTINLWGVK